MAAAAASAASVLAGARRPVVRSFVSRSPDLLLHSPRPSLFAAPLFIADGQKHLSLQVRATSSSEETSSSIGTEELLADLKQKWDSTENKSTVFIYGGGAVLTLWLSSTLIGAINTVPLLPKILELVGIGYSGWFVYRYLLFKSSRKELAAEIEDLKKKIVGTD
ncbi:hypothetical protein KSP39_PZI019607 [Platanthera zijinensis]|uniref:Cyanobacterial aminoacyl-tRNA synthetase CAAD domain-containing protein n=1 Tax=Platanthera zijinensis TaxID=2320716 RepID=A0AAP0FXZ8_9ASPA